MWCRLFRFPTHVANRFNNQFDKSHNTSAFIVYIVASSSRKTIKPNVKHTILSRLLCARTRINGIVSLKRVHGVRFRAVAHKVLEWIGRDTFGGRSDGAGKIISEDYAKFVSERPRNIYTNVGEQCKNPPNQSNSCLFFSFIYFGLIEIYL